MKEDIVIPIHRAFDAEFIKERMSRVGSKGLDICKAEELGVMMRISNLMCAIHSLTMAAHMIYGEVDNLFSMCGVKKHDIKRACSEFEKSYDRWFSFWRQYQTVDGVVEMNRETAALYEQFMRWACLPVHWELGGRQDAPCDSEPLIEIDRGDRVWRVYRDVAECEANVCEDGEWAVMRSDETEGMSTMSCVERGMDKSSAKMSAKRLSANDKGRLYTACRFERIEEKRLEVIPYNAYYDGEVIGSVKERIKG